MEMAVEANDRHGARVKLELEAAPLAADATPTLAVNTEAADNTSGDECTRETDVKTLKLRLFQELQRSRRRDAWQTYWRALQQYVIAKLSVDELHCVVQTLLTPEAVELHNRFTVAILDQSQANSKSLGSDSHGSKRPPSEDEKSIEMDASGNTAAKETAVKTEEPSEKATRPKEAKSAVVHHTDRESGKKNGKRRFPSISSPEVSDENDIDTSVKKLLHFANSNRASASREDTDEQSAELLIGLGQFSSKLEAPPQQYPHVGCVLTPCGTQTQAFSSGCEHLHDDLSEAPMGNMLASCGLLPQAPAKRSAFTRACKTNEQPMKRLSEVGLEEKQLCALHQIFSAMDRDNSREINMIEFFTYIDIQRSCFSEKAFTVMDKDGSGEVNFIEFVVAVWNYCSFTHASLIHFAFDLYDLDGSGEIEHEEAVRCVREVWGSSWEHSSSAQKIISKLDGVMEGTASHKLSVQQFQEFALRYPMLLFPAFQLQSEIQKKVLGEKFWLRTAKKRARLDPRDLNWVNVQKLATISKQTSTRLLNAMEDGLNDQYVAQLGLGGNVSANPASSTPPPMTRKANSFTGHMRGFMESKSRSNSHDVTAMQDDGDTRTTTVQNGPVLYDNKDLNSHSNAPSPMTTKRVSKPKNAAKARVSLDASGDAQAGRGTGSDALVLEDLDESAATNAHHRGSIKKDGRVSSIDRMAPRKQSLQKGRK
ncbi:Visinin protein 1, partial [Globisporangium splendens]